MQMTKEEFDMEYKGEFDYDEINADFGENSRDEEPAELESFDPAMEPSEDSTMYDDAMEAYADNGEEGLCDFFGCTMSEMSTEIEDMCREKGLHPDDDRDECIPHVVDDMIDNRERKDHGEPEMDEDLQRMRHLAGLDLEEEDRVKTVDGQTVMDDGRPLSFADWRSETESETGKPMKRSPEDQERDYDSYVNRVKG